MDMRQSFLLGFLMIGAWFPLHGETQQVAWPGKGNPQFILDAPVGWKVSLPRADYDYIDLEGLTGLTLSFRAITATELERDAKIQAAVEEAIKYLRKTYGELDLKDKQTNTVNGLAGFYIEGTGIYIKDKTPCVFFVGFYVLTNGSVVEIWFEGELADTENIGVARKIIKTLREPGGSLSEILQGP
jgi:hypothetical protein